MFIFHRQYNVIWKRIASEIQIANERQAPYNPMELITDWFHNKELILNEKPNAYISQRVALFSCRHVRCDVSKFLVQQHAFNMYGFFSGLKLRSDRVV